MSDKATRQSFGEAIRDLGKEFPNIVVMDADLSCSTKSGLFAKEFPDRFFQMGIAESNMIGTAAGMAFAGYVPFICSFSCFLTGRYETIRVSIGYSEANVKLVGTHSGIGIGEDGYSQMGLEDINTMRGLSGMTIIQPADDVSTREAVRFCVTHKGPVYLRLTRQSLPPLYKTGQIFQPGRGIILKEGGSDLALLGTGATVVEALKASEELSEHNPWVVDMHTLKPIDRALVKSLGRTCKTIVTVEDHNVIGGLGSAISEVLAEEGSQAKLVRLGIVAYGESGKPKDLYEKYGLAGHRVAARVKESLT